MTNTDMPADIDDQVGGGCGLSRKISKVEAAVTEIRIHQKGAPRTCPASDVGVTQQNPGIDPISLRLAWLATNMHVEDSRSVVYSVVDSDDLNGRSNEDGHNRKHQGELASEQSYFRQFHSRIDELVWGHSTPIFNQSRARVLDSYERTLEARGQRFTPRRYSAKLSWAYDLSRPRDIVGGTNI